MDTTVNCKTVRNRRKLQFRSLEDVLADAEILVSSPHTRTLGNWPLTQMLTHLAASIHASIDGLNYTPAWYARLFGFFVKGRILRKGLPTGVRLPKELEAGAYPTAALPQAGLEMLHAAVARSQREKMAARHPFLGRLGHDQWILFHLRHAELHLSFAVANEAGDPSGNELHPLPCPTSGHG